MVHERPDNVIGSFADAMHPLGLSVHRNFQPVLVKMDSAQDTEKLTFRLALLLRLGEIVADDLANPDVCWI